MHRAAAGRRDLLGRTAELAGKGVAWLRNAATVRSIPGAGGAVAVSIGLGQMYHPLLWVAAGAFLLLLDRRIPG